MPLFLPANETALDALRAAAQEIRIDDPQQQGLDHLRLAALLVRRVDGDLQLSTADLARALHAVLSAEGFDAAAAGVEGDLDQIADLAAVRGEPTADTYRHLARRLGEQAE